MYNNLKYLSYILKHKWFVFVAACKLGIFWRGLIHDMSKFSRKEWIPYREYFYGDYPDTLKEEKERMEDAFDAAWLNHIHHNPHHWQYWILREDDGGTKVLRMPIGYMKEMLADWIGAGKALGKPDTKGWYLANKDKIVLHDETRAWIEKELGV